MISLDVSGCNRLMQIFKANSDAACEKDLKKTTEQCQRDFQTEYNRLAKQALAVGINCTTPGCEGQYTSNGFYSRTFYIGRVKIQLNIMQVRCLKCGKTHAILLSVMVPYSRLLVAVHVRVAQEYEKAFKVVEEQKKATAPSGTSVTVTEEEVLQSADPKILEIADDEYLVDVEDFYSIARLYSRVWRDKLRTHGVSILNPDITQICFRAMNAQVMQPRLRYANYLVCVSLR